jgi:hypothetical protein
MTFADILGLFSPTVSPLPNSGPSSTQEENTPSIYNDAIKKGFEHWGSPPAATLSATYAQAPQEAEIFKKYPFLLPAQSLAETSGGAKQKFTNNPQNWGIGPQEQGNYTPETPQQNIMDAMSGIGGTRSTEKGDSPDRLRSQSYYDTFRDTGDLQEFVKNYAPPTENNTAKYVQDLLSIMSVFQNALDDQKMEKYNVKNLTIK